MANSDYLIIIKQVPKYGKGPSIVIEAPIPDTFAFDLGTSYEQMLPQGFAGSKLINGIAAGFGTRLGVQALTAQLWAGNSETELSVNMEFHTESDPIADVQTPIINLLKLTMPSASTQSGLLGSPGPYIDPSQITPIAKAVPGAIGSATGGLFGSFVNLVASNIQTSTGATPTQSSSNKLNDANQTANGANNTSSQKTINPQLGTAAYWKTKLVNNISIQIGNYLLFDSVVITNVSQTFASNFDAQTGFPHHVTVAVRFKPLFMMTQEDLKTLFMNGRGNAQATPSSNSSGASINFDNSLNNKNLFHR